MLSNAHYSIGIDPGWVNCGVAIVKEEAGQISLVSSETLVPKTNGAVITSRELLRTAIQVSPAFDYCTIERYVSYKNVNTAEAENILMLIGMLNFGFQTHMDNTKLKTGLVRAIEWKTELVKLLFKNKGFDNPSTSLDKKFSIAAAHACLDVPGEFKNDHEADAVCLASLPFLLERYPTKRIT